MSDLLHVLQMVEYSAICELLYKPLISVLYMVIICEMVIDVSVLGYIILNVSHTGATVT